MSANDPNATLGHVPRRQEKPTYRRRRLGNRLREQRGTRKAADVATELGGTWSDSKISKVENGITAISVPDVRRMLRLYGTPQPAFDELVALARHAQQVSWYHDYRAVLPPGFGSFAELEADTTAMGVRQETLIPGLLQTSDYAVEILQAGRLEASDEEIDQRLEARTARRETILSRDPLPRMDFLLGEAALRLPVGGPRVMTEQLDQLLADAERPEISLHVVTRASGPTATTGFPYTIFTMPRDLVDVVYSEALYGSRYEEDEQTVAKYRLAYNATRAQALSPVDSLAAIAQIRKEVSG